MIPYLDVFTSDFAYVVLSVREWRNCLYAERNRRMRNCRVYWHLNRHELAFGRDDTHGIFLFSFFVPVEYQRKVETIVLVRRKNIRRLLKLAKFRLSHGANVIVSHAHKAKWTLAWYRHTYVTCKIRDKFQLRMTYNCKREHLSLHTFICYISLLIKFFYVYLVKYYSKVSLWS